MKTLNRTPTRLNGGKTPHQALKDALTNTTGNVPDITRWRTFGSTAYVYILKQKRAQGDKFSVRAQKGKLVGYDGDYIYRIYIAPHKIIRSAHVTFDEANTTPLRTSLPTDDDEPACEYVELTLQDLDINDITKPLPLDLPQPPAHEPTET